MQQHRTVFSINAVTLHGDELDLVFRADPETIGWQAHCLRDGELVSEPHEVALDLVLAVLSPDYWDWAVGQHHELLAIAQNRFDQARGMLAASTRRGAQAMGYGYADQQAQTLDRLTNELDRIVRLVQVPGEQPPVGGPRELVRPQLAVASSAASG
jgi:hypothetical protein